MLIIMGITLDEHAPPGFAGLIIGLAVAGMIIQQPEYRWCIA
jgi:glycerol uptake facilitator protein